LPHPPGPTRVTRRALPKAASSSPSSRERPTNDVSPTGTRASATLESPSSKCHRPPLDASPPPTGRPSLSPVPWRLNLRMATGGCWWRLLAPLDHPQSGPDRSNDNQDEGQLAETYRLTCDDVARREGFEPPTARSVVSHHPSPPALLIPSGPRWSWSAAISLVRSGHPSLPVTCRMVAMWSQIRAIVARLGVWRQVTELAA
jgi:hypothetical protein